MRKIDEKSCVFYGKIWDFLALYLGYFAQNSRFIDGKKKSQTNLRFNAFVLAFIVIFASLFLISSTTDFWTYGMKKTDIITINSPVSDLVFDSGNILINVTSLVADIDYIYVSVFQNKTIINSTAIRINKEMNKTTVSDLFVLYDGMYNITFTIYGSEENDTLSTVYVVENVSVVTRMSNSPAELEDNNTIIENKTLSEIPQIYEIVSNSYSIFLGDILSVFARLSYSDKMPVQNSTLTYLEGQMILGRNNTDSDGWSVLNINTSNKTVGNHTINVTSVFGTYNT
ncbi:MAG: hypothetical protein KAR87_04840, partial [Candidatus Aenigmarchaeota archaeon]|nr:hypothetical protein [Candidatus Aenigmarchaeota archaeon]